MARDPEGRFLAWKHTYERDMVLGGSCCGRDAVGGSIGMRKIIVESDCKNIVLALNCRGACLSDAGIFVEEGKALVNKFEFVQFKHVSRNCNEVAHKIAYDIAVSCEGCGTPPVV